MFKNPSLTTRIGVGKLAGLMVGLLGVGVIAGLGVDLALRIQVGMVLWYATLGAVVGVFGTYDQHPVVKMALPWWLVAVIVGAWMNFVLVLIAFDELSAIMTLMFGTGGALQSPYWFVAEGGVVGWLIGWAAARLGGYGPTTVTSAITPSA